MSKARIRKFSLNITGVIFAVFFFIFGIWQHELVCGGFVWANPEIYMRTFQWFSWPVPLVTTLGQAYDLTLFVEFLAFLLLFASLWTWNE